MVLVILLVLALFVLQTLLPGRFREPVAPGAEGRVAQNIGNRDHMRPLTIIGQRAARALANMHEALPVFLALALLNVILSTGAMALIGAWIFFAARLLYVPLYLAGVPWLRSILWGAGCVGFVLMLIPLLDRL